MRKWQRQNYSNPKCAGMRWRKVAPLGPLSKRGMKWTEIAQKRHFRADWPKAPFFLWRPQKILKNALLCLLFALFFRSGIPFSLSLRHDAETPRKGRILGYRLSGRRCRLSVWWLASGLSASKDRWNSHSFFKLNMIFYLVCRVILKVFMTT